MENELKEEKGLAGNQQRQESNRNLHGAPESPLHPTLSLSHLCSSWNPTEALCRDGNRALQIPGDSRPAGNRPSKTHSLPCHHPATVLCWAGQWTIQSSQEVVVLDKQEGLGGE